MIRVLVADDSATARELLRDILHGEPDICVVGEATNGLEAVELVEQHRPDIVLMDVHMPFADGLEATKEIMMRAPTPIIVVSSAATREDVDLSLSATQAGALLALPKPDHPSSVRFPELRAQILAMVRAMSEVKVVRRWSRSETAPRRARRPIPPRAVRLIALAASTGGPPALRRILMDLPVDFPAPILLVQHIARDFTAGFAEWLGRSCAVHVKVAEDGERLRPATVYVAPDDRHLGVTNGGHVALASSPPLAGFRPSASHLFSSAGAAYGPRLAAVVLTGMGSDGADGLVSARAAGAYILAQDEASSVVYGMAREAVRLGLVDAVVPLQQIATRLMQLTTDDTADG
jgi:two-component system, chemotaxis family, protein-glutamate methylesterase/glutaminase